MIARTAARPIDSPSLAPSSGFIFPRQSSLLGRIAGLGEHREECAPVRRALDSNFTSRWVGFDAGLRIDALQRLGNGLGAAAASHVWNVKAKHLDLPLCCLPLMWGLTAWQGQGLRSGIFYFRFRWRNSCAAPEQTRRGDVLLRDADLEQIRQWVRNLGRSRQLKNGHRWSSDGATRLACRLQNEAPYVESVNVALSRLRQSAPPNPQ